MKRSTAYPLIALVIILLFVSGILLIERRGGRNILSQKEALLQEATDKLEEAGKTIAELKLEMADVLTEKEQWEKDKLRVGTSIARVKTVLIDSLADLDKVTQAIGTPENIVVPATQVPAVTQSPTAATATALVTPAATPRAAVTSTARPTPAQSPAPTAAVSPAPTPAPSPSAVPTATKVK